jgi:hypothetical protein
VQDAAWNDTGRALWLIRNIRPYLTGFSKRVIRPETGKDSQNHGGGKYAVCAFTISVLTMIGAYAKNTFR